MPDAESRLIAADTSNGAPLDSGDPDALVNELVEPLYKTNFLQTDSRGQITGWNSQAEEAFGWTRSAVLGQEFVEMLIPPESRDAYREGFSSFLTTGEEPILGRVRLRHRDGHLLPVALAIVPIPLALGYEFNRLLQALRAPLNTAGDIERLNSAHTVVFESIRDSLRSGLIGHELANDFWRRNSIAFPEGVPPPPSGAEEDEVAGRLGGALAIYRLLGGPEGQAADEADEAGEAEPAPAPQAVAPAVDTAALEQAEARVAAAEAERDKALARVTELELELGAARSELEDARRLVSEADAAVEEAERREHELRAELARMHTETPTPPTTAQPDEPMAQTASQIGLKSINVSPERIQSALSDDGFIVYWQPVLSLSSNEVDHVELLLRLQDDSGRMMLPDAFLDAARGAGLMLQVDHWVLRYALRLMAQQPALRLALNLSSEAVSDPDLPSLFEQEISAWGVEPGNLIVDVSERHAVNQMEAANRLQKRLRALGVAFALDDFGSTFGSFRCLKQMRLDYLKLDADLIDTITESRTDQLVVKALVDVAAGLGIDTIAEHVSDEETLEHLRGVGVGYAQGYAIGRPKPVSDLPGAQQASASEDVS